MSPIVGGAAPQLIGDEEPYSGPLSTTFQYEVFARFHDAESLMTGNRTMAVLLETTTTFVEYVVADTFGLHHAKERVDKNPFNNKGERRKLLRQSNRRVQVLLQPNSVAIGNITDVECSNPTSIPPGSSVMGCQMVTAETVLVLADEPEKSTALTFQMALSRALENPGMTFPEGSGIVYAGPVDDMPVSMQPDPDGVTAPNNPPGADPPAPEKGDTPKWVVPVSILAAALGCVGLVLFAGNRIQKRKRQGIEYQSATNPSGTRSLENDIMGNQAATGSFDLEVQVQQGGRSGISPLDPDASPFGGGVVESGETFGSNGNKPNPFDSSNSSSSVPSGSFSSQSFSSSSSDEDISNYKPREDHQQHIIQQEPQAVAARASDQLVPVGSGNSWQLGTLHEVSETDLSTSAWSLMSGTGSDKSERSIYRSGVEALVKEACPENYNRIDEMMAEYAGRESVLIGNLSTMLAAKNGSESDSDTDDSEKDRQRSTTSSDFTMSTFGSYNTSSTGSTGVRTTRSTLSTLEEEKGRQPTPKSDQKSSLESTGASTAILEAGGSASAAVVANLFNSDSEEESDKSSTSSAGSSEWSSDDGFSSIDTSSLATNDTPNKGQLPPMVPDELQAISDVSAVSRHIDGGSGDGSKLTFAPANGPVCDDGGEENKTSSLKGSQTDSLKNTRNYVEEAVQKGDWKAVGTTASLIATTPSSNPNANRNANDEDFNASAFSVSSHEKREVDELEKLVEAGNWEGLMAAASKFDSDSDGGSNRSNSLTGSDTATSLSESRRSTLSSYQLDSQTSSLGESMPSRTNSLSSASDSLLEFRQQLSGSQTESQASLAESRQSTASDSQTGSESLMESRQSMMSDFQLGSGKLVDSTYSMLSDMQLDSQKELENAKPSRPWENPKSIKARNRSNKLTAEIEELVLDVVPDEHENLDEMLLQFRGREEELLKTLRTMQVEDLRDSETFVQLGDSLRSLHQEEINSNPSIFESELTRRSSDLSSSFEDNDSITTGSEIPEKLRVCSRCSKHVSTSEYSEAQLGMGEDATCKGCVSFSA